MAVTDFTVVKQLPAGLSVDCTVNVWREVMWNNRTSTITIRPIDHNVFYSWDQSLSDGDAAIAPYNYSTAMSGKALEIKVSNNIPTDYTHVNKMFVTGDTGVRVEFTVETK